MATPAWGVSLDLPSDNRGWLDIARILHADLSDLGRIGFPNVSLGSRVLPTVEPTSVGISPVVPILTRGEEVTYTSPPFRGDATPLQEDIQTMLKPFYVQQALSPEETAQMESLGYIVIVGEPPAIEPAPIVAPTTTTTSGSSSMDLGSILTDLGTAYIQTKYAPSPTVYSGPVQAQPAYTLGEAGSDIIDFFTDPATGTVVPVKKKKKCRRRRRRLATKSDLGDLAALKAILGNGATFTAWIATHGR